MKTCFPWISCLSWYYNNCVKVTYNYVGILLALKVQTIPQNRTTVAKTITENLEKCMQAIILELRYSCRSKTIKGFKNHYRLQGGWCHLPYICSHFLRFTGPIGGFLHNINLFASLRIAAFQTKKMTMPGRGGGGACMDLQSLFRKTKQLIKIPFFNQIFLSQLHHCKIHTACWN